MLFPDTATTIASFKPALEKVLRPIEEARGLPAGCYTDDAWLRFESQALFARQWSAACFATDLPVDGSAFPVVLAGMPLVAVRDRDATIRVFHNFCRHRGMRLVTGSQQGVGGLRCPYHSWSYKLNGDLAQTPKFGGEDTNTHPCFNKKDFGLIEVASTVWCGIVFVDVSGQAGAFADRVAQLDKRWHQIVENEVYYPRGDSSFELAVESNWKLAVENYCESYHLPWVHPGLSSYSTLADHYHLRDEGGAFAGQGTVRYAPMLDETGLRFPSLEGLDAFWMKGQNMPPCSRMSCLGRTVTRSLPSFCCPTGRVGRSSVFIWVILMKPSRPRNTPTFARVPPRCGRRFSKKTFLPCRACNRAGNHLPLTEASFRR